MRSIVGWWWQTKQAVRSVHEIYLDCKQLWRELTRRKQGTGRRQKTRWLINDALYYGGECLFLFFTLMRGNRVQATAEISDREETVSFEPESDGGERRIVRKWVYTQYGDRPPQMHIRCRRQGAEIPLRKRGCVHLFCPAETGPITCPDSAGVRIGERADCEGCGDLPIQNGSIRGTH